MAFDLLQKITQLEQRAAVRQASGQNVRGLLRRIEKLRRRLPRTSVAGGIAAGAMTLGLASMLSAISSATTQADPASPSGSTTVAGASSPGGFWGVTIGDATNNGAPQPGSQDADGSSANELCNSNSDGSNGADTGGVPGASGSASAAQSSGNPASCLTPNAPSPSNPDTPQNDSAGTGGGSSEGDSNEGEYVVYQAPE
jgi:hypothetical protein